MEIRRILGHLLVKRGADRVDSDDNGLGAFAFVLLIAVSFIAFDLILYTVWLDLNRFGNAVIKD